MKITSNTVVETYSGIPFDLLNPRPEDVRLEDIAHGLANICRFNGHTHRFYSVAEHTVRMVRECSSDDVIIHVLLHDAAEAYIGDISRPMRSALGSAVLPIEMNILKAIYTAFGVQWPTTEIAKEVRMLDLRMLATEKRDLMSDRNEWVALNEIEPFSFNVIRVDDDYRTVYMQAVTDALRCERLLK